MAKRRKVNFGVKEKNKCEDCYIEVKKFDWIGLVIFIFIFIILCIPILNLIILDVFAKAGSDKRGIGAFFYEIKQVKVKRLKK